MVDPTPLLKGFGAAANVASQIATDKAINGRRQSKGETAADADQQIAGGFAAQDAAEAAELQGGVEIQNGQLIKNHNMATAPAGRVPHSLGRIPNGGFAIFGSVGSSAILCNILHEDYVEFNTSSGTYTLWIF